MHEAPCNNHDRVRHSYIGTASVLAIGMGTPSESRKDVRGTGETTRFAPCILCQTRANHAKGHYMRLGSMGTVHKVLAAMGFLALAGLDLGCDTGGDFTSTTFEYGGVQRSYEYYQSAQYDGTSAFPVMIVLYGKDMTVDGIVSMTGMNAYADDMGFNVIYPNAYDGNWNDGRDVAGITAYDENIDDVGFIGTIIDRVEKAWKVDSRQVYVAGISNGAMMAYRLACETPERFAAVASVAGSLPVNIAEDCEPSTTIPIIAFNGTSDGIVPWNGGTIELNGENMGSVLSVPDTISHWLDVNKCSETATVSTINTNTQDGTTVYREVYTPQTNGADVVLYRIEGGGHTWPGGPYTQVLAGLGAVTYDIDASQLIAEFCLGHTR